ncbi:hypothetical protein CDL15_Pgr015574 [Punica granatum]|uniref:Uncharacterized protein n=1 Tax=Punica granatum TaxID=22663 RepID=A0A218XPD2_PUNGR|nr:hypothetical protein CDL15_Pgr015574 [Punica granatum]
METVLYEAAAEGDVSALQMLLWDDKLVLDRVLSRCFTETPLHIAAMLRHREFVKEILSWKPEMAKELDFRKSSPLHLATARGHVEVVKLLLSENPEAFLGVFSLGCPVFFIIYGPYLVKDMFHNFGTRPYYVEFWNRNLPGTYPTIEFSRETAPEAVFLETKSS